ncbi:putative aminophospholipid-translocating P4-type ATPase [Neohortaea acidophila]|uniref:Phospholipid-transporting ATPase n=1 Tax=Neohortaea acidophila TaxID=245834 RepID=A0A6A6PH05_9PEZI|nr:putative aminophospholipid-translocating P4-type ATPase [Neohortaea acidophila]KAF2478893.1 putative aminophospholipid-translocating P4-type ATPase [Neohortaea acidophila]
MSRPTGYRQPPDQDDFHEDDRASDIDIDLDELDPHTSSATRPSSFASRLSQDFGNRIPLRNLRFGGRRRPPHAHDADLEALADEGNLFTARQPVVSSGFGGEDDAPLLTNGYTRRASHASFLQGLDTRQQKWPWRLLPAFMRPSSFAESFDPLDPEDEHDPSSQRTITVGQKQPIRFPLNAVSHAKYTAYSFLPRTLYNEFKLFLNMYFLLVAVSQILPALRIGYLSTYIAPLAFVISVTLGKEAYDDMYRRKRDNEANSEAYKVLRFDEPGRVGGQLSGESRRSKTAHLTEKRKAKRKRTEQGGGEQAELDEELASSSVMTMVKAAKDLKVGDVLVLSKGSRIPADVAILKSVSADAAVKEQEDGTASLDDTLIVEGDSGVDLDNETTTEDASGGGEAFIRTDQLDGETDWKLRLAVPLAQALPESEYVRLQVIAGKPDKRVNDFAGTINLLPKRGQTDPAAPATSRSSPLTIDHTAWANTVLASNTTVHAVVIYTGPQTRAALSTSEPRSKIGLLELEINSLTKILCILTAALSFILVALEGFNEINDHVWYVNVMRFLILFSTIVPISLRVNLDMGKSVYAWYIHRDPDIPGTVVRTSTIPEDLGRIEYLLTDKTGTLTRNEMVLRKVHVGTVSYGGEAMEEVSSYIRQTFALADGQGSSAFFTPSMAFNPTSGTTRTRREIGLRVRDLVLALALSHNVTPTIEEDEAGQPVTAYQASSPDEIAIVQWTELVGLKLAHRDRKSISLQFTGDSRTVVKVEILNLFPFTSDSKRMGIVVRFLRHADARNGGDGEIVFFQKGADTVMTSIVAANDWLDEETANMAREGLRTLVIGRKTLSSEQYAAFTAAYSDASLELVGRDAAMARVVKQHLEHNLELLGVTGVEDKLQPLVKSSLELLKNAGIKIWMLTGDKVETARCIAVSSKLVSRGQYIHTIAGLKRKEAALDALSVLHNQPNAALLIDGQSLAIYLQHHRIAFITLAVRLPAVIACRCSPTQKADVARLIRAFTKKRIACIGDGGNDVSMIQAADVGVGIVGKEGRQASLAADFSITQFAFLTKLLVWHGRNSYKRSAKLAQFVIHRGLIISVCQTVFSVASHFEPIALYRDWLLVGYATIYTMMPVFSLVLDQDVDEGLANLYPELYKELTTGRSLSYKTFFVWVGISVYQGLIIQGGSELLDPGFTSTNGVSVPNLTSTTGFKRMVSVSYTVLVINELVMVAAEITTWHPLMIFSIVQTALVYFGSLPFLGEYFDLGWIVGGVGFWWRFAAISAASLVPVYAGKVIRMAVHPPSYRKVRGV